MVSSINRERAQKFICEFVGKKERSVDLDRGHAAGGALALVLTLLLTL
jgi:hypothetical protein